MNAVLAEIFRSGTVEGINGAIQPLHSNLDQREGELLQQLIAADARVNRTLEIGCAFGISSLFICEALRGRQHASHTAIDPFQHSQWDGVGLNNIRRANYDFFTLIEEKSEFALPRLLQQEEESYDFILVDGFHTFDHTLVDCFYATRLLRIGGYLVIDDVVMPAVRRAMYYLRNYPCFSIAGSVSDPLRMTAKRRLARTLFSPLPSQTAEAILATSFQEKLFTNEQTRMVALKKTEQDTRPWDWYSANF